MRIDTDVLVIGSGLAGLTFAIKASQYGRVSVVTKKESRESNTNYAQGGIAAVLSSTDSFSAHIKDTVQCGDGLCHEDIVTMIVPEGPSVIKELSDYGVTFDFSLPHELSPHDAEYDLGQEGGHSTRRIAHATDFTGMVIERVLTEVAKEKPAIEIFENHIAIDLITSRKLGTAPDHNRCLGAYVLSKDTGDIITFSARITVLATGGAGKVYLYTSNPDIATGAGIAMAYRAEAQIANMEFIQFHPTCLYHPKEKSFLISEALRGEGGKLRVFNGEEFMEKYHERKELAPRDIVARAIDNEMKIRGDDYVLLDMSHKSKSFLTRRFPNIYKKCKELGFAMETDPLPVVPAAHYICGGVLTDSFGETTIQGLLACGEVACTGFHGANRLASNSLLEAVVIARRASDCVRNYLSSAPHSKSEIPDWNPGTATDSNESVVVSHNWDEIRRFMWDYVSIVRTEKRLERARHRIENLKLEIKQYYWDFIITPDLIELRNIADVADLIIRCASQRKESRGLHYNLDYPHKDDVNWKKDTIVSADSR